MTYTQERLRAEMPALNAKLAAIGHPDKSFQVQGRNGYTAIDLYIGEQCERMIGTGTPRECYAAATDYIVGLIGRQVTLKLDEDDRVELTFIVGSRGNCVLRDKMVQALALLERQGVQS